ncbi:MAG: tetratricopeptide repeat protein [Rickettsia endosymbiont of Glossina mortisans submortisans]|nr:tetratricopeptide repeat protein [Rickettsia endosymbiont of Glossina mortisans submortisans]
MKELIEFLEKRRLNEQAESLRNGGTTLNLSWHYIEDEGAKLLAEALKSNNSLTYLDLRSNKIGAEEEKLIESYLQRNRTIAGKKAESLNVEGNELYNQGEYSEAIKKYKAAIKITKESLHKENKLYEENKAIAEKKYEEQQSGTNRDTVINKVEEIIYEKPLLNHPKLLQTALDNKLSPDLIYDAITNNDEELILAGLISVGYDVTQIN